MIIKLIHSKRIAISCTSMYQYCSCDCQYCDILMYCCSCTM